MTDTPWNGDGTNHDEVPAIPFTVSRLMEGGKLKDFLLCTAPSVEQLSIRVLYAFPFGGGEMESGGSAGDCIS